MLHVLLRLRYAEYILKISNFPHVGENGCEYCHCNEYGALQGNQCNNITGECQCRPNVQGIRCEECASGFFNLTSGDGCQVRIDGSHPSRTLVTDYFQPCECNDVGSAGNECNVDNGQCVCKPGVTGLKCDKCAPNHYGLDDDGCKRNLADRDFPTQLCCFRVPKMPGAWTCMRLCFRRVRLSAQHGWKYVRRVHAQRMELSPAEGLRALRLQRNRCRLFPMQSSNWPGYQRSQHSRETSAVI